jgi:dihydroorotase
MHFDLLIKGGEVIDPGGGHHGLLDVAIKRNRIAAVEANIPPESAFRVIDGSGQIVTPGLIDLHTHVYRGATYWGINADTVAWRTGVTTWLDVGSAGAFNLPGFREFIVRPSPLRIYAYLNISSIGLVADTYELANMAYCDVALFEKLANLNRDLVYGVKVRMGTPTVGQNGILPMQRARAAADACELPLMVHIAIAPPSLSDVLALMRPNDILTHCYTGHTMRLVDEHGAILDVARQAWDAGVIMDVGHGGGSFAFSSAEALIAAGYKPHVISSDIHQDSIHGPMFDLPTVMSKFLLMGMSLPEVIHATTARPAAVLGLQHEIGTLTPGALADVALFRLAQGSFPLYDVLGARRDGDTLLRNTLTILDGRPLTPLAAEPPAPWIELSPLQREIHTQGHTPEHMRAD